jgi:two-component system chemotaxis response regulator CheB
MSKPRIVVIGTSAGGLEILNKLVEQLPEDFPASVFIVMHMATTSSADFVAKRLQKHTKLKCKAAENKELIQPGVIYVAPADHHLLISGNYIIVTQGPRENQFRPAIDPLFRSAAASYGSLVIGIILTGMLNDGTVGMDAIKRSGGIAIVQDPDEAEFPEMPLSVLSNIKVDYSAPVAEMGALLIKLIAQPIVDKNGIPEDIKLEAKIAERVMGSTEEVEKLGKKVAYTCPDCGGNLWEMTHGSVLRYRCHLGHAFSAKSLLKDMNEAMEETLWIALRMMEERKNLLTTMLDREESSAPTSWASGQRERVEDIKVHINRLREVLMNQKPEAPEEVKIN